MSFSGFVFDMIRRDKENRNSRNIRRERYKDRLSKMYKGHADMPQNTTPEALEEIAKRTVQKEISENHYRLKMTVVILCICFITSLLAIYIFIK